ncbi:hypothetical protein OQJ18_02265 [Fluoribacter dumoffii]|uniref:Uncharacterized protein n=1 Tax=Fluoribacter dumoffii TaxID=463 RepID=A0A377GBI9_9GAMM|nr:hypothetical protein [Fluoribacter dumoffii]KTC88671.1 hypothetical protein Ldum_2929 [Fluoribacter dumoffii NY 23]MCW8386036.1 hypothetical protein [Fluoribacter dumoffii]MCW8419088.1 hypothetical protein [Fluoribacter dumoffii]MCW8453068.1 hypothetical protein [Fluoribacter dumoffii]MCW8459714.1 hypothetical protein [Fluoribacter dumoffii]
MSDFKSKLPDLKELASMTNKLFTDIKKSVGEIVHNYKETRAQQEGAEPTNVTVTPEAKTKTTVEETKVVHESTKTSEPVETVESVEVVETIEVVEPPKESKTDKTKE